MPEGGEQAPAGIREGPVRVCAQGQLAAPPVYSQAPPCADSKPFQISGFFCYLPISV